MTNTNAHLQLAHLNLVCLSSSLVLERVLQTVRYRGFSIVNMSATERTKHETRVALVLKGQAKLTTLQKSLEALVEVQQCYLTEDQAKLTTLIEMGLASSYSPTRITRPNAIVAEGL